MDLNELKDNSSISQTILNTKDKVLILRFGNKEDNTCMHLDNLLFKCSIPLINMAEIHRIEVELNGNNEKIDTYLNYFDINFIPSTIFFFNGHHIKVDYNSPDHSKLIGSLKDKQDFLDLVEVIFRGASRGKTMVQCPIPKERLYQYQLFYQDI